jgi:hypothetical protein
MLFGELGHNFGGLSVDRLSELDPWVAFTGAHEEGRIPDLLHADDIGFL